MDCALGLLRSTSSRQCRYVSPSESWLAVSSQPKTTTPNSCVLLASMRVWIIARAASAHASRLLTHTCKYVTLHRLLPLSQLLVGGFERGKMRRGLRLCVRVVGSAGLRPGPATR